MNTDSGPGDSRPGALVLSPSSLTTFTECEMRYAYDQLLPRGEDGHRISPVAKGAGLTLGTAVHTLLAARWQGLDWTTDAVTAACLQVNPNWSPRWQHPDPVKKAIRLVARHEAMYPVLPRLIATEWQFKIRHPRDPDLEITGYQDGLTLVQAEDPEHEGLWVLETKTMGRWDRLDWLPYDPQPVTYMWAARAQGVDIRGVLFDAIYTKEWVGERAPEESFRRLWLLYDQSRVDRVLDDYEAAAARIRELQPITEGTLWRPVRNAGRACLYCPHVAPCHGLVAQ